MSLPYYKRFPRKFVEATVGWSLEQKGAYGIVIDLIFMRGGQLPDDAGYIAGLLGCSVRKWNSLKAFLIGEGKLYVSAGIISNKTADDLLEETRKYRDQQAENRAGSYKNKAEEKPSSPSRARSENIDNGRVGLGVREIQSRCLEAAGLTEADAMAHAGLVSPIEIIRLIRDAKSPCDLELDVIPAIQACAASKSTRGETLTNWSYCREAILRNRDKRLAGNPAAAKPPAGRGGQSAPGGKPSDSSRAAAGIRLAAEISARRGADDGNVGDADPWSRDGLDAMWAGRGFADGAGPGRGHLAVAFDNGSPAGEDRPERGDGDAGDGCLRPQATRVAG